MGEEHESLGVFELHGDLITADALKAELEAIVKERSPEAEGGVQVDPAGAAFLEAAIVIVCLPLAKKILEDLWDTVVLPRIEEKWGRGSLKRSAKA